MIRLTILLAFGVGVASAAAAQPIVVLIGGNHSDPSPAQLAGRTGRGGNSGLWRFKQDLKSREQWDAAYFNWNGTPAGQIDDPHPGGAKPIEKYVREQHARRPEAPVIIVGNSWGGHTAWEVCRLLNGGTVSEPSGTQHSVDPTQRATATPPAVAPAQAEREAPSDTVGRSPEQADSSDAQTESGSGPVVPVDLLIVIDPSSLGRGKEPMPTTLPDNVKRAINYYTHNAFGWRGLLEVPRLTNIDLGDPQHGFLVPGGPRYDAAFNLSAHIASEWDERLHAAIRREMAGVVDASANQSAE